MKPRQRRGRLTSRGRQRRAGLALAGVFAVLVSVGALALAVGNRPTGGDGLLPPPPERRMSPAAQPEPRPAPGSAAHGYSENDLGASPAPGAARLAGPPASVVRRFAQDWANRDTALSAAIRREMVGLSAGAWASAVFRQARLTLPAIEGVRAEGGLVMMKLTAAAPQSKTALVVTRERLLSPEGGLSPPRYVLYLARLDRAGPRGYAITAWEPQL
jgi:hypothetical protein